MNISFLIVSSVALTAALLCAPQKAQAKGNENITVSVCDIEFELPAGYRVTAPSRNKPSAGEMSNCAFDIHPNTAMSRSLRADLQENNPGVALLPGVERARVLVGRFDFARETDSALIFGDWEKDKKGKWRIRDVRTRSLSDAVSVQEEGRPSSIDATTFIEIATKGSASRYMELDTRLFVVMAGHNGITVSTAHPAGFFGALNSGELSARPSHVLFRPRKIFAAPESLCGVRLQRSELWHVLDQAFDGTCQSISMRPSSHRHISKASPVEGVQYHYFEALDPNPHITLTIDLLSNIDGMSMGDHTNGGTLQRNGRDWIVKNEHSTGTVSEVRKNGFKIIHGEFSAAARYHDGQYCCTTDAYFAIVNIERNKWLKISGQQVLVERFLSRISPYEKP
jgi:hypothetical protein